MMILFIVQFNGVVLRPSIPRLSFLPAEESNRLSVKFFDDCSIATAYNLKNDLEEETDMKTFPLTYSQRTGHRVKRDRHTIQQEADDFYDFTVRNKFVINDKKSHIMIFNFSRRMAFPPDVKLGDSDVLSEVNFTKILGVYTI